ncbi:type IV pilus twitching motility protein PilT [Patescibacteria group bacterium]|nr:type IV pilus twitching motility protein PilT [Patescibacteria group bacterium]MBU1074521.1 type IV pilus twitching motility protein PilT [Patescibacteria group bacterium]MBU1951682.1 type IV pilus twitching motility protein PilT [Patescibacteria group bacterium]MBU2235508.1 type IV pilus twitching motility protein PilT [Patescibacteria group bacterium]
MTLDDLLSIAVEKRASDLHMAVGKPPILRIDGALTPMESFDIITPENAQELVFGILSDIQKERLIKDREIDISHEIPDVSRFRVNIHWEKNCIGLVARVVTSLTPTMEELEMPKVVYNLLDEKQGLILITGPTGCGKSTSLAAMINYVNSTRSANIITLEDPIEFIYKPKKSIIKQRQLGSDMLSFADALKHVLRQDPNVILVGEMRDLETIAATITLAETGHLVLATLHTYSAAQTVDRIIDVFPPYQQSQVRLQLSMFLKGVISQQLIPKVSKGRVAAREILINTPAISNLIRENKIAQIKTVIQTGVANGMKTMDQDLKRLYKENIISKDIAKSYMMNPETMK